jgi:hypothetical protein
MMPVFVVGRVPSRGDQIIPARCGQRAYNGTRLIAVRRRRCRPRALTRRAVVGRVISRGIRFSPPAVGSGPTTPPCRLRPLTRRIAVGLETHK